MLDTVVFCIKCLSIVICKYGSKCSVFPSVSGGEKVRFSISVEGTEHETLDERDVRQQTKRVINFHFIFLLLHFLLYLVEN